MSNSAGLGFVLCLLTCATSASAQPDDNAKRCTDAYVQSQELRLERRLIEAKRQAALCMAPTCPEFATKDCARWLDEIESALPSVVLRYVDETGREHNDVTVTLDGKPLTTKLDGTAMAIDPGPHTFVFRVSGADPVEHRVTIAEGEKLRQISVSLVPDAPPPLPPPVPVERGGSAGVHPAAWVLYAVSALGVGAFAGLGAYSLSLEDCKPGCTDDEVDDLVLIRAFADVSLGVGVLALGAAIWVTVASLSDDEAPTTLRAGIVHTPGGPVPGMTLSF